MHWRAMCTQLLGQVLSPQSLARPGGAGLLSGETRALGDGHEPAGPGGKAEDPIHSPSVHLLSSMRAGCEHRTKLFRGD